MWRNPVRTARVSGIAAAALGAAAVVPAQFQPASGRSASTLELIMGAEAFALLDLDGDGRDELLTNDFRNLRRHDPQPDGSFRPSLVLTIRTVVEGAVDLHAVDVDGDGDRDLLWLPRSPQGPQTAFYLLQNDRNTLVPWPTPVNSVRLRGVAAADFDGDGDIDLAVGNGVGTPTVQFLQILRNQAGTFVLDAAALPAATPICWPVAGDFDGDGDADLLARALTGAWIWFANQGGVFADRSAQLPAGVPTYALHAAVADLDNDGRDDVAIATPLGRVDVLWGGAAGFAHHPGVAATAAERIRAGDIDGDGAVDLVAIDARGCTPLWNRGPRAFAAGPSVGETAGVVADHVGDVNGDGRADVLLATGPWQRRVRCLYGPTLVEDEEARAGLPHVLNRGLLPVAGDLDGDGRTDLVSVADRRIEVHLAEGARRYRTLVPPVALLAGAGHAHAWLTDLDGDGDPDLVVQDSASLRTLANDGYGNLSAGPTAMLLPGRDATSTGMADVDGDGDDDFVHVTPAAYQVIRNVGGGLQAGVHQWPAATQVLPRNMVLADLDGDGDPDLVCDGQTVPEQAVVLVNDGTGAFAPGAAGGPVPPQSLGLTAGDADGDGDVDVLAAAVLDTGGLVLLENDGRGRLTASTRLPVGLRAQAPLMILDADGDGDQDLLAGAIASPGFGPPVLLLRNTGTLFLNVAASGWNPGVIPTTAVGVGLAADADGDGDLDVLFWPWWASPSIAWNHTRHLASARRPRVGGQLDLDLYSGPGYSPAGTGILVAGLGQPAAALAVAGLAGRLDLAAPTAVLSVVPLATIGVSRTFVPLPNAPQLVGAEIFFQGLVLSAGPQPSGFTNSLREVILP